MNRTVHHPPCWATRSWLPAVSLVIGMILFFAWTADVAVGESNEALARKIIAAWKKRAKRIRTVRAEIVAENATKKRAIGRNMTDRSEAVSFQYSRTTVLVFDFSRKRYRYEWHGGIFNATLGRVTKTDRITVIRDGYRKTYKHCPEYAEQGLSTEHHGIISPAANFVPMVGNFDPVLWYVRPLGRTPCPGASPLKVDQFRVVRPARATDSGLIECGLRNEPDLRFLVDGRKDYVIVQASNARRIVKVSYVRGRRFPFVPSGWSDVILGTRDSVRQSTSCRLRNFELNEVLDDSVYELTFPKGTIVEDLGGGGVHPTMVAAAEGHLRPLVHNKPVRTRSVWQFILLFNLLLVLLLAAFLIYRRVKHAC